MKSIHESYHPLTLADIKNSCEEGVFKFVTSLASSKKFSWPSLIGARQEVPEDLMLLAVGQTIVLNTADRLITGTAKLVS